MSRSSLFALIVVWAGILILGSILPIHIKDALNTTANHHFIHPALHIGCFAVLGLLGSSFPRSGRQRIFNTVAVIGFGLSLEILEVFYYHQKLETRDVRLDAYGALIGFVSYFAVRALRDRLLLPSGFRPAASLVPRRPAS